MTNAQSIVDLLNHLLRSEPEAFRLLLASMVQVSAPEDFNAPGVFLRYDTAGLGYLTVTGVISAIGAATGNRIVGKYDDGGFLIEFTVQEQPLTANAS